VVWSEPNMSQIEAWSSTLYAWYQEFEFKGDDMRKARIDTQGGATLETFFFQWETKTKYFTTLIQLPIRA
jgi:hypothetical protein